MIRFLNMLNCLAARLGLGHELLSIIIRSALILLSTLDPGSLVRRKLLTSLRPSRPIRGIYDNKNHQHKLVVFVIAARLGLEPRYTGPKPVVLPLDDLAR